MTTPQRRVATAIVSLALVGATLVLPAPALALAADEPGSETTVVTTDEPTAETTPEPAPVPTADVAPEPSPVPTVDENSEPAAESPAEITTEPSPAPSSTPTLKPAAIVGGVGFTVDHVWVDPTILNANNRPFFQVTFVFPPIDPAIHAVVHARAPNGVSQFSHCQVERPLNGTSGITCDFFGTITPGETSTRLSVRSEEGHDYEATVPVTMCPLTGCSGLFAVTAVQAAAVEACAGETFTANGAFDFNVAWNATTAALGAGTAGLALTAPSVRDGGSFSVTGVVNEPGERSIPIIVTDEFGTGHSTSVNVTITSPSPATCASLAATGATSTTAIGLGALALVLAGVLGLQHARPAGATRYSKLT